MFLPPLDPHPHPFIPDRINHVLLYIDNNPYALANVLNHVRNMSSHSTEAVESFRRHIHDKISGPMAAARKYGGGEDADYLDAELRKLSKAKQLYPRTYVYWNDMLRHYRNQIAEGNHMLAYLPGTDEFKKREGQDAEMMSGNKRNAGVLKLGVDVAYVLKNTLFDHVGCLAIIPASDLGRKLYEQVKGVMEDYGGKWSTSKHSFVFPDRASIVKLETDLKAGVSVNQKTKKQAFYTPSDLAWRMVRMAGVGEGTKALEPSAGRGNIALKLIEAGAEVTCFEVDPDDAKYLESQGYGDVFCLDFLNPPKGAFHNASYDAIVMNPPFTKGQDVLHIMQAWKLLKPGGTLVTIANGNVLHNTQKKYAELRDLVSHYGTSERLPPGIFKESGTSVSTVLIALYKPGGTPCPSESSARSPRTLSKKTAARAKAS